jgi:hypothetical protein
MNFIKTHPSAPSLKAVHRHMHYLCKLNRVAPSLVKVMNLYTPSADEANLFRQICSKLIFSLLFDVENEINL